MSLYEVLALAALVCAGSYAWHLYRKDTRPRGPDAPDAPPPASTLMFGRTPRDRGGDGPR